MLAIIALAAFVAAAAPAVSPACPSDVKTRQTADVKTCVWVVGQAYRVVMRETPIGHGSISLDIIVGAGRRQRCW